MRTAAQNAELALLLEVTGTPKPGNVDRHREYDDLRFEQFVAGAVGAQTGLRMAAAGEPLGESFLTAIEGMSEQRGGNTQFGAVLLTLPLVAAAGDDERALSPAGATTAVESTTVADAGNFYRAFEAVDVAVDDPPEDMEALDVRRGGDAVPTLERRGLTLADIMERSAERDGVAREWVGGFERVFAAAESIRAGDADRPVTDRAADVFLELLAEEADTFVVTQHDRATAEETTERARRALDGDVDPDPETLADRLVAEEINPGTTADTVAAALFVALERGIAV